MFLVIFQQNPAAAVALLLGLVVGVVVHEAAHAYSAYLLGDDTAYRAGRVTLNPASHLDLLGSMMFLMAGFGWGKPTPVVTSKLRGGVLGPVAVAAAGPLSNLLIVAVCAALFHLPRFQSGFVDFMNQYGPMILLVLVLLTFLPMLPSPLSYILVLVRPVLSTFGFPPIL